MPAAGKDCGHNAARLRSRAIRQTARGGENREERRPECFTEEQDAELHEADLHLPRDRCTGIPVSTEI